MEWYSQVLRANMAYEEEEDYIIIHCSDLYGESLKIPLAIFVDKVNGLKDGYNDPEKAASELFVQENFNQRTRSRIFVAYRKNLLADFSEQDG